METRFSRADEESRRINKVRPSIHVLNGSTRAKSRGGYLCREGTSHDSYPQPPLDKTQTSFSRSVRRLRAEKCPAQRARAGSGEARRLGGGMQHCTVRIVHPPPPKINTSGWPVRHCGHWQLARSTIENEGWRGKERREGAGAVMRRCGLTAMAFILFSGLSRQSRLTSC